MNLVSLLLILALLILINGAFSLAELALVSARRAMLTLMERQGVRGAAHARALADNPQNFLPASQFGITLIGIMTGVIGGRPLAAHLATPLHQVAVLAPYAEPLSLVITVVVITFFTL